MKKITPIVLMIFLFSTTINAQENFDNLWEKVQKFELDNLPKSALKVVEDIYAKAEKNNNAPQIIKTLFYKSKFTLILEEDAQLKVINQFKKHIDKSKFPTKNVLENVLANLYWQYFNQNRWKFYQRTKTAKKVDKTDFRTWDLNTLFAEIHTYYKNSLQEKLLLQKVDVYQFSEILNTVKDSKKYRPTLYDFLANNALTFYKTQENNITKPAYQFKIDDEKLLSDATSFSRLNLTSKDTLSLQFNALKIYQDLIGFHIKDKNPEALVDIDLQRLHYVNKYGVFKQKQAAFLKTLNASKKQFKNHKVSGLYAYEIATIYSNQANSYNAENNKEHRFKNREALEICNNIIKRFPESLGAKKCQYLKVQIEQKTVSITSEKYIPIQKNSRFLINYKNVGKLYFSAYKINKKQLETLNKTYKDSAKISFIKSLDVVKNWNSNLRNEDDFLQHTTEVVVPKMANGNYLIVASESEKLQEKSIFGTTNIQATNLVLIEDNSNGFYTYQVVNRNNGKPIVGAKVNLRNYNPRTNNSLINENFTTDKNGFFAYKSYARHNQVIVSVNYKEDTAFFGNYYLYKYRKNTGNKNIKTQIKPFIFTDRSIYRPGQKIYFKAIVIQRKDKKSEVFTNKFVDVILNDVNGQEVKKLNLKLNEFGSIAGEFTLPNNGLTGTFSIQIQKSDKDNAFNNSVYNFQNSYHSISVEEYKRPKFKTEFKPVTESFKLNDSITVNGFAKAFAGSNITDAKVVYRVHRKVQYPSWWYWRIPNFNSEAQEITHGESVTNAKGEFEITFKAIPDKSVSKESQPVFTYEITAAITDVNGETRSATSVIKVGYHTLVAKINIPQQIDVQNKENTVSISTENLNGEFVTAKGTLQIYKLQAPKNLLRTRSWNAPYYQDISENDFRKLFPHEPYTKEETNEHNWKKGTLVFEKKFDTKKSKEIALKRIKNWISGKYIAVIKTQDTFNQKVKEEARFTVFNSKKKEVVDNQLCNIKLDKERYKVGETALLEIGSASKDISVVVQIERNHKIDKTQLIHLNNEVKTIKIPVKKEDENGFAIRYHFVNFNEFKSGNLTVNVFEEEETIAIETKTFRDKLQPGSEQTWSFSIKNDKKNKVTAEVLASMYDASLDEFKSHNWSFNPIQKTSYYSYGRSNASQSFGNTYFQIRNKNNRHYSFPNNQSDSFNFFGFSFTNNRWLNQQYLRRLKVQRTKFDGIYNGIVEDESGPLPGVNVLIKGTDYGTETDFDGKFSLKAKKGDVIIFNFVGMKKLEKIVTNFSNELILMQGDSDSVLDEVVVTAYGTTTKRSTTGAVEMLEGKAAGVSKMDDSGQPGANSKIRIRGNSSIANNKNTLYVIDGKLYQGNFDLNSLNKDDILEISVFKDKSAALDLYGDRAKNGVIIITTKASLADLDNVKARKNLQETAFFFPQLQTDTKGNVSFNFTTPEALTRWKVQLLAHTKDVKSATKTLSTVTQKELMVVPNAPRFLREGDKIVFSSKISNLTKKTLNGFAKLQLTNAISGAAINTDLKNLENTKNFTVDKNGNTNISWTLSIPKEIEAVQYKVIAKAGDFSDGEQNALPVLTNRMLVTETLPMWVRSHQTKTFTLDKLKSNNSSTLRNHKLTLEVASNPAWYAVQALPYLMEYPYECAEQTFAKYYANTLASYIANSNPKIQKVFNAWKSSDALLSNLEKNQELKSLIIQETPWLRDAQSETEQKKRIGLLFDLNRMKNQQQKTFNKLKEIQMSNGGFPWFKGSNYANTYITNYIATGFGHLNKLGVKNSDNEVKKMLEKAINFLDEEMIDVYQKLILQAEKIKAKNGQKEYDKFLKKNHLSYFTLQYLYMRSFYTDVVIPSKVTKAVTYYKKQTATYWNDYNLYAKAQIALLNFRNGNIKIASKILKSLEENSITSDELGMYWKENTAGYYYYQSPIETQSLLIEAFSEIENNTKTIDNLKIWLLKNKQVNQWKTTKATSEAVYALLLQGSDWISVSENININLGDIKIEPSKMKNVAIEAGSGYFKTSWNSQEITPKMSEVTISKKGKGIAWCGLYWQYFEDLDKITSAETPLKLKKKIFLKVNSDTGKELKEVTNTSILKVGNLLTVRIELRADRTMEFIHMKDMRASGLEPINVLSKYKWQDGLGYYESTKDAATNFFFDRLPKGVYVFEYDVRVNNAGDFSNGITTIQSMYAPEFSSHSKGIRIKIQ